MKAGVVRQGRVVALLPNGMYRIELSDLREVLAHVSARREKEFLRLLPGDRVEVELSSRDPGRGRVTGKSRRRGAAGRRDQE